MAHTCMDLYNSIHVIFIQSLLTSLFSFIHDKGLYKIITKPGKPKHVPRHNSIIASNELEECVNELALS